MFQLNACFAGLGAMLALAVVTWLASIPRRDVSMVDSVWPLFFLLAAFVYLGATPASSPRDALVMTLVAVWALRLCAYLTWRNWGESEDYRYRQIRARNEPRFALKSLYLVFGLQAVLAWVVSLPLLAALAGDRPLGWLDYAGAALAAFGVLFESVADGQLARFMSRPINRGRVLDSGLWRYTRHPNYFGECCVWWGLYLIALSAGGAWSVAGPLLMTVLLLKVSGVVLLEQDIGTRRPAYRRYVETTSAFVPWFPRSGDAARAEPTR